jgi:hypothetical protein
MSVCKLEHKTLVLRPVCANLVSKIGKVTKSLKGDACHQVCHPSRVLRKMACADAPKAIQHRADVLLHRFYNSSNQRNRCQAVKVLKCPVRTWEKRISQKVAGMRRVPETLLPPMAPNGHALPGAHPTARARPAKAPGCTRSLLVGPYGPCTLVP